MKLLLANGADVDPSSSQYQEIMAAASKSGNPRVISMLQKVKEAGGSAAEAEQNVASEPLPIEQDDEVSRLLQEGSELNAQDMNNFKGLLESVSATSQSILRLLTRANQSDSLSALLGLEEVREFLGKVLVKHIPRSFIPTDMKPSRDQIFATGKRDQSLES